MDLIMNLFSQLPHKVEEMLAELNSEAVVGNLTFGITQYTFWLIIAMVIMLVVVFVFVKKQQAYVDCAPKSRFVNAGEYLVEFANNDLVKGVVGDTWREHFPFIATVFIVILFGNAIGLLPGSHPGTGAMGVTLAVALCSFCYFVYVGIKKYGGLGYIKSLAPKDISGPIKILVWAIECFSTILRLFTLAVRLFCNMYCGHAVLYTFAIMASMFLGPLAQAITPAALGAGATSIIWLLIMLLIYAVEFLVAGIQAYLFATLSSVYVQLVENEH